MKYARDIMTADVGTVSDKANLEVTETFFEALHVRHVPIVDCSNKAIAILSIGDVLAHILQNGLEKPVSVSELIASPIVTASPDTAVEEIAQLMKSKKTSAVGIIEEEQLIGIVTERDFLKLFL